MAEAERHGSSQELRLKKIPMKSRQAGFILNMEGSKELKSLICWLCWKKKACASQRVAGVEID